MKRRTFLATTSTFAIAGCSALENEQESPAQESDRFEFTERQHPQVDVVDERYHPSTLTYSVDLDVTVGSADEVIVSVVRDDMNVHSESEASDQISVRRTKTVTISDVQQGDTLEFEAKGEVLTSIPHYVGTKIHSGEPQERFAGLSYSTVPEPTGEFHDHLYTWGNQALQLRIPDAIYQYCQRRPRIRKYGFYGDDPFNNEYTSRVAQEIQDSSDSTGEAINNAIRFVQSLEYTRDDVTTDYDEYPRYPIETLVDKGGDCEDTAILLASLLKGMGYETRAILIPPKDGEPGHMATGVAGSEDIEGHYYAEDGTRFYYIETTGEDWRLGDIPQTYKGREVELLPMTGYPVLNFSIETIDSTLPGGRTLIYNVMNYGETTATNARFQIEFINPSQGPVGGKEVVIEKVKPERKEGKPINIILPKEDIPVKIRTSVFFGSQLHDRLETDILRSS